MKILKRILIAILAIVVLGVVASCIAFQTLFVPGPNQLRTNAQSGEIQMVWASTFDDPTNRYGAMLVPVTFPGLDRVFHMQFDLGHPTTSFKDGFLKAILERTIQKEVDTGSEEPMDTNSPRVEAKIDLAKISNLEFNVGDIPLVVGKITTTKSAAVAIPWDSPEKIVLIGTIGSDFVDGKVIALDYPKGTIRWSVSEAFESTSDADWLPFFFRYRRTLLPAKVNQKETLVMFDSGASAFDLITDSKTFEVLATPGSEAETARGNSWGKKISITSRPSQSSIDFGSTSLPMKRVTKIDGMGVVAEYLMGLTGMQGMTGNTIFLEHTLVLDYSKQRFAIR